MTVTDHWQHCVGGVPLPTEPALNRAASTASTGPASTASTGPHLLRLPRHIYCVYRAAFTMRLPRRIYCAVNGNFATTFCSSKQRLLSDIGTLHLALPSVFSVTFDAACVISRYSTPQDQGTFSKR